MSARYLTVVDTKPMGPNLQRVIFHCGDLAITTDDTGGHIKLFFKQPGQEDLPLPERKAGKISWPEGAQKPIARTYSIADYSATEQTLSVDFVIHEPAGPASKFAQSAQPGDIIGMAGPGPKKLIDSKANRFLFIADLSALPAMAVVINKQLTAEQELRLVFVTPDSRTATETLQAYFSESLDFIMVIEQNQGLAKMLIEESKKYLNHDDSTSISLAGEHNIVVEVRHHLRQYSMPATYLYAVPYWRKHLDEEGYHAQRHAVMD